MSDSPHPSVAIIYGIAEGPLLSRRLRQVLAKRGYSVTSDVRNADIILAHSGGCYLVPDKHKAKAVVYVGYTYWPGRRLAESARAMLHHERQAVQLLPWLRRSTLNLLCLMRLPHSIRLVRNWPNREAFLSTPRSCEQIFVRNRYDTYCEPNKLVEHASKLASFISLPGGHNHIWEEPDIYADLLQSVV